jgi:hypothetical protein
MAYIFGRGSFHCHGDQILSSEQHQAQYPLLFTLRLFRILGPVKGKVWIQSKYIFLPLSLERNTQI